MLVYSKEYAILVFLFISIVLFSNGRLIVGDNWCLVGKFTLFFNLFIDLLDGYSLLCRELIRFMNECIH
jgi:hypothetical protein